MRARIRGRRPALASRQSHFELVTAEPGATPDTYVVTLTVTGDGFNGTGPMNFELRGRRVASLFR
jgi:hypothetical protein